MQKKLQLSCTQPRHTPLSPPPLSLLRKTSFPLLIHSQNDDFYCLNCGFFQFDDFCCVSIWGKSRGRSVAVGVNIRLHVTYHVMHTVSLKEAFGQKNVPHHKNKAWSTRNNSGNHSPGQQFSLSLVRAEDGWSRFTLSKKIGLVQ